MAMQSAHTGDNMHIEINEELCNGHAQCELSAPEVFSLNEDGIAFLLTDDPAAALREDVQAAIRRCPESAITVVAD
jgi:ferredoxin